jgi:hypothetical protein
MATLGATGVDDRATAPGAHAHEKSMGALTANFRGLVGAFHSIWPYRSKKLVITTSDEHACQCLRPLCG